MKDDPNTKAGTGCPLPIRDYPNILMAHGGGGRLMQELLVNLIRPVFSNPVLDQQHDSAVLACPTPRLAFTTDTFVVRPLFFPGGDVGSLAVHGTVNDLAMSGARPRWLSAALIIEEGFPMEALRQIAFSMQEAARSCGVIIVTGDTKVVERGKGDGLFINTAGIGTLEHHRILAPASLVPGDAVLISGDVGRHGIAIMSAREGLQFESTTRSDSAPLIDPVLELLEAGIDVHCLRDLTRGGLASALNELAAAAGVSMTIDEENVPIRNDVRAACELLGLDPWHVACEGRMVAFVPAAQADAALGILRAHLVSDGAAKIGTVATASPCAVVVRNRYGTARVLHLPSGEQLPRIC